VLAKILRQAGDFTATAARQQRDDLGVGGQIEQRARGGAVNLDRNGIGERVSHELRGHTLALVEPLLERQQAQHQIDRLVNAPYAALPPGPHLRTDVLHRRNPRRVEPRREPQVGVGRVDPDEHIGACGEEGPAQTRQQAEQARQLLEYLEESHHGERLGGLPDLAAGGAHLGTRDAEELHVRLDSPQRLHQSGPERVSRRLSRHEPYLEQGPTARGCASCV
jgi:hypothetical protein